MVTMPAAMASRGLEKCRAAPSTRTVPRSGRQTPPRTRISLNFCQTTDYKNAFRLHCVNSLLLQSVSIFVRPCARSIPFVSVRLNLHQRISEFLRQAPSAVPDFLLTGQQQGLWSLNFD